MPFVVSGVTAVGLDKIKPVVVAGGGPREGKIVLAAVGLGSDTTAHGRIPRGRHGAHPGKSLAVGRFGRFGWIGTKTGREHLGKHDQVGRRKVRNQLFGPAAVGPRVFPADIGLEQRYLHTGY